LGQLAADIYNIYNIAPIAPVYIAGAIKPSPRPLVASLASPSALGQKGVARFGSVAKASPHSGSTRMSPRCGDGHGHVDNPSETPSHVQEERVFALKKRELTGSVQGTQQCVTAPRADVVRAVGIKLIMALVFAAIGVWVVSLAIDMVGTFGEGMGVDERSRQVYRQSLFAGDGTGAGTLAIDAAGAGSRAFIRRGGLLLRVRRASSACGDHWLRVDQVVAQPLRASGGQGRRSQTCSTDHGCRSPPDQR
jgi:hypothetical protein